MNQSSKEIGQPEELPNNEQNADNIPVSPSIANAVLSAGGFAGKKFAKEFTRNTTDIFFDQFNKLTSNELKAVIKRAESLTQTNCGWSEYWLKDVILKSAKDRLFWQKKERRKFMKDACR